MRNLTKFTTKNPQAEASDQDYGKRLLEETALGNLVSFYFGGWIAASQRSSGSGGGGVGMFDDMSSDI